MIQEIFTLDLGGVNAYLIKENEKFLLVDTGGPMMLDQAYNDRRHALLEKLWEHGCKKGNLKMIVLTHGDCDHCANAAYIAKEFGALIAMGEKDACQVTNLTPELFMKSCEFRSVAFRIVMRLLRGKILKVAESCSKKFETFTPDIYLKDKDSLADYGFLAEVISIPGHTLGSIGIYTKDKNFICGDLYQNSKKPVLAGNAWDFKQLEESNQKMLSYEMGTIYPGHGTPFQASMLKK